MSKETILKEFENKLHNVYATIFQLSGYNEKQLKEKKDVMNIFISKSIDQTREETIRDLLSSVQENRDEFFKGENDNGRLYYNGLVDLINKILNKLKK